MTSLTPNLFLPFPDPTDRPCDVYEPVADAAALIESDLLDLQSLQKRFLPAVPVVIVRTLDGTAEPGVVVNMQLDGVVVDTDGAVDLAGNAFRLEIPRDGMWLVGAAVTIGAAFDAADNFVDTYVASDVFGPDTAEIGIPTGSGSVTIQRTMTTPTGIATRDTAAAVRNLDGPAGDVAGQLIGLAQRLNSTADNDVAATAGIVIAVWLREQGL